jgi:hypothetical protein
VRVTSHIMHDCDDVFSAFFLENLLASRQKNATKAKLPYGERIEEMPNWICSQRCFHVQCQIEESCTNMLAPVKTFHLLI